MDLQGRKVIVAGAAGFVGSNLIPRLLDAGAIVRATLHESAARVDDSRIEYVTADLTRKEDCERVVQDQEIFLNCAANTSGAATIATTPMAHVTPNVVMNSLTLEAAHQAGVGKYIWLASTTGYPVSGDRPVTEDEMLEGVPFEKYHFVGWMKRFTEVLCEMYGNRLNPSMTTLVLRPTNIYGPLDDYEPTTSHVTAALIRKVVERQNPLEVWGDGHDVRDVIYVDDMVEAMMAAAASDITGYEAMNIGLGKAYSVRELLSLMRDIDDYSDARIEFNVDRPTMIPVRLVDISKAKRLLGFEPSIGIEEGLRQTIEWYRAEYGVPASTPREGS